MANQMGRWFCVAALALAVGACRSDEATCETLCDWLDECSGLDYDCSDEDEIEECAEDIDDLDADCDDALSEFVDCLDEQDVDCEDVIDNCQGEYAEFAERCEGEF